MDCMCFDTELCEVNMCTIQENLILNRMPKKSIVHTQYLWNWVDACSKQSQLQVQGIHDLNTLQQVELQIICLPFGNYKE